MQNSQKTPLLKSLCNKIEFLKLFFLLKKDQTLMFFFGFCKNIKNTYFIEITSPGSYFWIFLPTASNDRCSEEACAVKFANLFPQVICW